MTLTLQETLKQISQHLQQVSESPALDAQVLVAHLLGKSRTWVMAHPEAQLDSHEHERINFAVSRMERGEALPYILGHWAFYGLDFYLTPDVLIPRPETELLVDQGIDWLRRHPNARNAMDVGTGAGCIGIALAANLANLQVLLTDISTQALNVARKNSERFNLSDRLEFQQADLLEGVLGTFDLICANLPYIPSRVLSELAVSKTEPTIALDGGESGTVLIARLLDQARDCLEPGGLMLLEIEASQGTEVELLAKNLYPATSIQVLKDLSDRDRCVKIERSRLILHLCQREEWLKAQERGVFTSKSLDVEGFIHCSTPEQILQVANRFYRDIPDLSLLWIEPELISSKIRWEMADGTRFPHVYGPIDLTAIVNVTGLLPDVDGTYRLLEKPV